MAKRDVPEHIPKASELGEAGESRIDLVLGGVSGGRCQIAACGPKSTSKRVLRHLDQTSAGVRIVTNSSAAVG